MDKKKVILITAASVTGAALLSLLVMWVVLKVKQGKGEAQAKQAEESLKKYQLPYIYPLQFGSGSPSLNAKSVSAAKRVAVIQQICIDEGYELTADGIWGAKTEVALTNLKRQQLGYEVYMDTAMSPVRQCATTIIPSEHAFNQMRKVYKARHSADPSEYSMAIIEGEGNSIWKKFWATITLAGLNEK